MLSSAGEVGEPVSGFDATSSEEIDDEIREVFLEEFEEEIENLQQLLPPWRDDPGNAELLRPIRRVFHTLKGSGRLVGARALGEFSWKIESMLNRVLDGSRPASAEVMAMVQLALQHLPLLRSALQGQQVHADLVGIQDVADRLAAGEEATYRSPLLAAEAPVAVEEDFDDEEIFEAQEAELAVEPAGEEPLAADAETDDAPVFSIDPVLLEILKPEVAGHLETVDAWLAACAARGPQPVTDPLLRSIHTMNGAFAMTEVMSITEVTAPLEGFVKRSLAHDLVPGEAGIALVADAARAIRATVQAIEKPRPVLPHFSELAARAVSLRDTLPDSALPSVPLHVDDEQMPQVVVMEAADTSAIPDFAADEPAQAPSQAWAPEEAEFALEPADEAILEPSADSELPAVEADFAASDVAEFLEPAPLAEAPAEEQAEAEASASACSSAGASASGAGSRNSATSLAAKSASTAGSSESADGSRMASSAGSSANSASSGAQAWDGACAGSSAAKSGIAEVSAASITTTCGICSSSTCRGTLGSAESGKVSRSETARAASSLKCGNTGRGFSIACTVARMARAASATRAMPASPGTRSWASERLTKPSSGAVTSVMDITSVIANAPFIVWIERSSGSVTGCGPRAAQAASQASTVSRCPATSGLRISSNTGSMENTGASSVSASAARGSSPAGSTASSASWASKISSSSKSSSTATGASAANSGER